MPRPAQLCPPTHLIPRLSCLSWCIPSSLDLGEGHEVSLTGASCSKGSVASFFLRLRLLLSPPLLPH